MGSRFSELINVEYSSRRFLIIFIVVMIALNFDAAIANDADILSKFAISFWGLLLFIMICLISVFGQYYILRVIKEKNRQAQLKPDINDQIEKLITIAQYTLIGLTAAVVFQLLGFNHYNTHLLILWIAISYGLASLFMGFLSYRFFYWFKLNRSVIVLSFGLAAAMITINALDTIILNIVPLIGKTTHTTPQSEVIFQTGYYPGTVMSLVAWLQSNSVLGYIIATWVSTILLLRGHIRRVGRVKFWILVTVPLIYFMSYNISLFQSLYPNSPVTTPIASNLMIPILLTVFATTLCGILFGIGFWLVSRAIKNADVIRDYMLLTAYGIVLFFTAADAGLEQAGYPPFGISDVSFVQLSSFMILIGLYYSATSVANDLKLRKSIKHSAREELKLLDNIGTAQTINETQNKVLEVTKRNAQSLVNNTGVELSLTDDEMRRYINDAIEEANKLRAKK